MIDLNIKFQEEYKRLDALCKDLFNSNEGVTEYIRAMENTPYNLFRFVPNWNAHLQNLKRMRHIRNQLAHEVGSFNSDLCAENDIEKIKNFYQMIMNREDPLAVARQIKQSRAQQSARNNTQPQVENNLSDLNPTLQTAPQPTAKKDSFWKRVIVKIKKFFS